jgi:hypothetical protein
VIYKFLVPQGKWTPVPSCPGLEVQGCVAVVEAPTEAEARAALVAEAAQQGYDVRWLEVARVYSFGAATSPRVITYAEGL